LMVVLSPLRGHGAGRIGPAGDRGVTLPGYHTAPPRTVSLVPPRPRTCASPDRRAGRRVLGKAAGTAGEPPGGSECDGPRGRGPPAPGRGQDRRPGREPAGQGAHRGRGRPCVALEARSLCSDHRENRKEDTTMTCQLPRHTSGPPRRVPGGV